MKNIAIIPARSGSKGLPDKNIKIFCGKPLLAWTIEAALKSGEFDEVMVSTDSERYREIALEYGAEVPFLRSEATSSDTASSWDAVREVISKYAGEGRYFDTFCMLQPTSPLRNAEDITGAYDIFKHNNATSVVSLCELEHSINICNRLPENKSLDGFYSSNISGRRQDADKYYRINGAIYIQTVEKLMQGANLYDEQSYAYIMDKANSVDIDDEIDFISAEAIYNMTILKKNPDKDENAMLKKTF